jgi:glycosyltransferase involved in cell wall biosynthesis
MKILHLINSLGSGGAERQASYLVAGLASTGVSVRVAFCKPGPNEDRIRAVDCDSLIQLPSRSSYSIRNAVAIQRFVRNWKPDLIQTWLPMMDVLGGVVSHINRIPHVISERSQAASYGRFPRDHVRRLLGRISTGVIANSRGGCEYWFSSVRSNRLHLVPNGLPIDDIVSAVPIGESNGLTQDCGLVLFVGRLANEKNIPRMIDAIDRVLADRPNVLASLIGEGPMRKQLEEHIDAAPNGSRIRLQGFRHDVWAWMKRASALVAVGHFEGDPNVALEAAACGCPLVLSNIDAYQTVFSERTATFVDPKSPASIARGLESVLDGFDNLNDQVESARDIAHSRSMDSMVAAYVGIYHSALTGIN